MTDETTTVTRNDDEQRYEIHTGGVLAGFTEFRDGADGVEFPHTEIDPAFTGRGLATILVAEAMTDAASRGITVVPHCTFVAKYLKENQVDGLEVSWPDEPHPE